MKKTIFSGIVMGLLGATSAVADTTTELTTKGYVDAGLMAVYNKAKGLAKEAKDLATAADTKATAAQTAANNAAATANTAVEEVTGLATYVGTKSGTTSDGQQVVASGLAGDVEQLENDVGDMNALTTSNKSNLVNAINSVNSAVNEITNTVEGQKVQAGAGVSVNGTTVSVNGLNAQTAADTEGIYVFQSNQATKLNVATTWADPEWLN